MAYQLTSSTGPKDFLSKLVTFAVANGWAAVYDDSAGLGGQGGQIGLSKEECHVAIGETGSTANPVSVTDTYPTPSVVRQDFRLSAALSNSLSAGNPVFWGHAGSIVTSSSDGDRVRFNDCGAASEVHFFANDDSVFAVLRTQNEHYTHIGFGHLDRKGMTTPKTAFLVATYHHWWDHVNSAKANLGNSMHALWPRNDNAAWQLRILAGTLDPSFGYLSSTQIVNGERFPLPIGFTVTAQNPERSGFVQHWAIIRNFPTTGGVAISSFPVMFKVSTAGDAPHTYLGDIPIVRLCDISDVSIAEVIQYGTDEYLAFPLKRRTPWGSSYVGLPTTFGLGVAFKK